MKHHSTFSLGFFTGTQPNEYYSFLALPALNLSTNLSNSINNLDHMFNSSPLQGNSMIVGASTFAGGDLMNMDFEVPCILATPQNVAHLTSTDTRLPDLSSLSLSLGDGLQPQISPILPESLRKWLWVYTINQEVSGKSSACESASILWIAICMHSLNLMSKVWVQNPYYLCDLV